MSAPKVCPCGCGRKVGWGPQKKGAAVGYVEMSDMLAFVTPIVQDSLRLDGPTAQERTESEKFLANGKHLTDWLLEHVHGAAAPARTPDLVKLSSGMTAFKGDVARILSTAHVAGWVTDDGHGNPRYERR